MNNYRFSVIIGISSLLLMVTGQVIAQPPLYTAGQSFSPTDRVVSTTVFSWYTATTGMDGGVWVPLEGRVNWTGEPDFWQRQIKDMMDAGIDVMSLHTYQWFEQQQINLMIAADQLRAQGYKVPKIKPFLDSGIMWTDVPIDVGTSEGKDAFVARYITFYQDYFNASKDPYAQDQLDQLSGKPMLNLYSYNSTLVTNPSSLSRADVESRLAAALGTQHPIFNNGIYLVGTATISNAPVWTDELLEQFATWASGQYQYDVTYNGKRTSAVKPGAWNQPLTAPTAFYQRNGGVNYLNAWNSANSGKGSGTPLYHVAVESWNEYAEGTGIYEADPNSPQVRGTYSDTWSTTNNPREYIDTTRAKSADFRSDVLNDAEILWHNLPPVMAAGQTISAKIIVRNKGIAKWKGATGFRLAELATDTPFFAGSANYVIDDGQNEIPKYNGIFKGRPITFNVQLTAPATPGTYTTNWRMNQSGTPFGNTLTYQVRVASTGNWTAPPTMASNYSPTQGSVECINGVVLLQWTAGTAAASHNVYFGMDYQNLQFKGNQTATMYTCPTLSPGQTYYWRIDEVNGNGTTTGEVMSFATVSGYDGRTCGYEFSNWQMPYDRMNISTVAVFHLDENSGSTVHGGDPCSPTTFTGTIEGNPNWVASKDPNFGSALHFDGSTYVTVPSNGKAEWNLRQGLTVEAWIKLDSYPGQGGFTIASCGGGPSAWQVRLDCTPVDGVNYCHVNLMYHNGNWQLISGTASLAINRWYHIAVTREVQEKDFSLSDPNRYTVTTRIYINGLRDLEYALVTSELPRSGDVTGSANCPMLIGMDTVYPATTGFVGTIDEVRISNAPRDYQPVISNFRSLYDRSAVGTEVLIDFDTIKSTSPLQVYVQSIDSATAGYCTINPTTPAIASLSSTSGVPGFGSYLHVAGGNSFVPVVDTKPAQILYGLVGKTESARECTVTVEAYVRLGSYPDGSANFTRYVIAQVGGTNLSWQLSINAKKHAQFSYNGNGTVDNKVEGKSELALNRWYHVSGVKKTRRFGDLSAWTYTTEMEVYVDGSLDGTFPSALLPFAWVPAAPYYGIYLGSSPQTGTNVLDGDIDEVRISSVPRVYGPYGTCQAGDIADFDFNKDCRIDLKDFAIMAAKWLMCNDSTKTGCTY